MSDVTMFSLKDLIGKYFYGFTEPFIVENITTRGVIEIALPIYKSKGHKIAEICLYASAEELDTYADNHSAMFDAESPRVSECTLFGLEMLSRHRNRRGDIVANTGSIDTGREVCADLNGKIVANNSSEKNMYLISNGINYVLKSINLTIQTGKTYITLIFINSSKRGPDLCFYGAFFCFKKIEK